MTYIRIKVPNLTGKGNVSRTIPAYVWQSFVSVIGDEQSAKEQAAAIHCRAGGLSSYDLAARLFAAIVSASKQQGMFGD